MSPSITRLKQYRDNGILRIFFHLLSLLGGVFGTLLIYEDMGWSAVSLLFSVVFCTMLYIALDFMLAQLEAHLDKLDEIEDTE